MLDSHCRKSAAMYGEDSSGRKVSLLNDSTSSSPSTTSTFTNINYHNSINSAFPRPLLSDRSRISTSSTSSNVSRDSCSSSRSSFSSCRRSPRTPPLVRLDSRSSINTLSTPSPMTPNYGFDPMDHQKQNNGLPYYPTTYRQPVPGYPSLHDATSQPYYNLSTPQPLPPMHPMPDYEFDDASYAQQANLTRLQPAPHLAYSSSDLSSRQLSPSQSQSSSLPSTSTIISTSTSNPAIPTTSQINTQNIAPAAPAKAEPDTPTSATSTKSPSTTQAKKKYPCPHAATYKCNDTFTTSGHAARHGRKHTGEKNIFCPTCNKAFTRKDNMKQHERTHKGGSSAGAASPALSAKSTSGRRSSTSSVTTAGGGPMDLDTMVPPKMERPKIQRSELSEILENVSAGAVVDRSMSEDLDGEGESPGLDALASVAGAIGQD